MMLDLKVVGQMSLGGSGGGAKQRGPQPTVWRQCLTDLCTHADELYLRLDTRTADPSILPDVEAICGEKLKDVLKSDAPWDRWKWREEMLRMLDSVRPDIVLTPDQDEMFGEGLQTDLKRLVASSTARGLMFPYESPMPTEDGTHIPGAYPARPHMKAYQWQPGLTYRAYKGYSRVTQYADRKLQQRARSKMRHLCFWTAEMRKARGVMPSPSKDYSVLLLRDMKGWAYDHRCQALRKYAPDDFDVDISSIVRSTLKRKRYDLILELSMPRIAALRQWCNDHGRNEIIVGGYNLGKGREAKLLAVTQTHADLLLVNNNSMYEALPANTQFAALISNGVDLDIFSVTTPLERRKPRVLWTASRYHLKTKGYSDILIPLRKRLKAAGFQVDYHIVEKVRGPCWRPPEELAHWYNQGTIYVVASRSEGTPNPALEAAACGCVVVGPAVGCLPELIQNGVNGEVTERSVDALFDSIVRCQENYVQMAGNMQREITKWHWKSQAAHYFDLFRRLIQEKSPRMGDIAP